MDGGISLGSPALPREKMVMPAVSQRQLPPVTRGHAPTQVVRGMRLATAGDVVRFSFDCEQRRPVDVLRTHQLIPDSPMSAGEAEFLEHCLDGIQIELGRYVEHGVIHIAIALMRPLIVPGPS